MPHVDHVLAHWIESLVIFKIVYAIQHVSDVFVVKPALSQHVRKPSEHVFLLLYPR
jgi:hypothetical protein